MPGIQSTKLTWKSEAFLADFENVAASMRVKRAMENWYKSLVSRTVSCDRIYCWHARLLWKATHQGSCEVDACGAGIGAVEPLRRRKAEDAVPRHVGLCQFQGSRGGVRWCWCRVLKLICLGGWRLMEVSSVGVRSNVSPASEGHLARSWEGDNLHFGVVDFVDRQCPAILGQQVLGSTDGHNEIKPTPVAR